MIYMGESFVFISDTNRLFFSPLDLAVIRWVFGFKGS